METTEIAGWQCALCMAGATHGGDGAADGQHRQVSDLKKIQRHLITQAGEGLQLEASSIADCVVLPITERSSNPARPVRMGSVLKSVRDAPAYQDW